MKDDVFYWCNSCQAYTPGDWVCMVCEAYKNPERDAKSLKNDLYPEPEDGYPVILEDGRTIEFAESRDKIPIYMKTSLHNKGRGGAEIRSYYDIYDYGSMARDPLCGIPDMETASKGVTEMRKDWDEHTFSVTRYTTNPAHIKDLNRRGRRIPR